MKAIPFENCRLSEGFWQRMQEKNRRVTIPAVYERFRDTGRVATMACTAEAAAHTPPHHFWGSDVFKWLESAAYELRNHPDETLKALCESIISDVVKAQDTDGYYNSYFLVHPEKPRFYERHMHELYSLGHMIEAAVAWDQATGEHAFLEAAEKNASLADRIFRLEDSAEFATPGHEEIELALMRLYRYTGNRQYRDLALFFVDRRGNNEKDRIAFEKAAALAGRTDASYGSDAAYTQSSRPLREISEPEGHAVRALYLYAAMADLALDTGDEKLKNACIRVFDSICEKYMYITGGLGQTRFGEAFAAAYDLPSDTAYCETCASIAMCFFAARMFLLDPDAKYQDVIETELYNGVLAGLSLSGDAFFYENPLCRDGLIPARPYQETGVTRRQKVFSCSCCPPNVTRLLAAVSGYQFTEENGVVYVHQFMAGQAEADGVSVKVETDYPSCGAVHIEASGPVAVRVPAWCRRFSADQSYTMRRGYAFFTDGCVTVDFHMCPQWMQANPKAHALSGQIALVCGPVVYCAEEQDNGGDVFALSADPRGQAEPVALDFTELPGFRVPGCRTPDSPVLYQPCSEDTEKAVITLIPFYACQNRGEGTMRVWMNRA